MTEFTVRYARPSDEEGLMEHLRMHDAENGVYGVDRGYFPFDDDEARAMLGRAWNRQGAVIGVIEGPNGLEASTCILISKLWFTKNHHVESLWAFVHPDFRKSNRATALIEFVKWCAVELEMPLVDGVVANHDTERKIKLYQRSYGYPVGAYFVYDGKPRPRPQENEAVFWDNPFPRYGVSVVPTKILPRKLRGVQFSELMGLDTKLTIGATNG